MGSEKEFDIARTQFPHWSHQIFVEQFAHPIGLDSLPVACSFVSWPSELCLLDVSGALSS